MRTTSQGISIPARGLTGRWRRFTEAGLLGLGVACFAPMVQAQVPDELFIGLSASDGTRAVIGNWVTIDQTMLAPQRMYGTLEVPRQLLWICDPSQQLPLTDDLRIDLRGQQWSHQQGRPTALAFRSPETALITRTGYDSCSTVPAAATATLPAYQNVYASGGRPDFTYEVRLHIDASRSRHLGLQARTEGVCGARAITALPGAAPVSLPIDNTMSVGTCTLQLRLCSVETSPVHRPQNACSVLP